MVDSSLELLRELAVTNNVAAALPRLSAIATQILPHDALGVACFDQRGRPIVDASTADLPDVAASEDDNLIIDDLRARGIGASIASHATARLVGAGYRSVLGVSTRAPEPLVRVAFWSKQPAAFDVRTCHSRGGSRTTSASEQRAATWATPPIARTRRRRSESTVRAYCEASIV